VPTSSLLRLSDRRDGVAIGATSENGGLNMSRKQEHNRADVYARITDTIVAQLERGVRPWMQPWSAGNMAGRITRPLRHNGESYSGMNVLLLWSEGWRGATGGNCLPAELVASELSALTWRQGDGLAASVLRLGNAPGMAAIITFPSL
jgi:antirestriction protein ArdC